ncbi:DUF6438 domain-containing protein [Tenacibaculum retecalamus]|uniref:DUF6438 domain-containing protein n=1 Tax=Tenacibaculum retecalamus TaxID=3018315 RepID=UPI0023D96F8E|nr:DUF6438 domain-containing protein [Tenacibaculum retecalamus]WBX71951.1 DUF6438 domain-containing protein [Tenacibaculum retecalamus]
MKYLLVLFFALILACNAPKKEQKKEVKPIEKEIVVEKAIEKPKIAENELIVVFKNPKKIEDAKSLLKNSGLTFRKMAYNKNSSKIGIIAVPEGKRTFWLDKLQKTNAFRLVDINTKETLSELINKEENTLISIRKTPCFGDCVVYNVTIDKNGNVTYNGIKYVLEKGTREFTLTSNQLEQLTKMLAKKDFNEFKDTYDDPRITDLASTYIVSNGKQVKIRLWNEIPDELIDIHEYIEGLLLDKKLFE